MTPGTALGVTLFTALPVGIAFGAVLERAGLGDPRVIAGQLVGRDFTVVRVMFGAIVTAMLGVLLLDAGGIIDAGAIAMPPTELAGQLIGGVIFGGGFALAALCPGTACVAAASGRREGVLAVIGLVLGTAITAVAWPLVAGAVGETREGATLAADLGVSRSVVAAGVTIVAVVVMAIARRAERAVHPWRLRAAEVVALTLAAALLLTDRDGTPSAPKLAEIARQIAAEEDHVDARDLAEWIRGRRSGLTVLDVREGEALHDTTLYVIPGARVVALESIPALSLDDAAPVVLYSNGGTHAAQAWVLLRARGAREVLVLKDGLAAWEDDVLAPALPPADADSATRAQFERDRERAIWFGGSVRLTPRDPATAGGQRSPRRRNTC